MESIPLIDRNAVAAQIGRRPRGLLGVPVRCSYGYPQVIRVRPLIEGEPFPTLFWLTCPYLVKEVDRLEAVGWIGRLEKRLAEDEALRAGMERAHRRYVEARSALLSEGERRTIESRGLASGLLEKGIGGIADRRRLKCLHLHVAHALADENPVGAIVLGKLSAIECGPEEVICSALLEDGADRSVRIDR
jgi:hypothetical protein